MLPEDPRHHDFVLGRLPRTLIVALTGCISPQMEVEVISERVSTEIPAKDKIWQSNSIFPFDIFLLLPTGTISHSFGTSAEGIYASDVTPDWWEIGGLLRTLMDGRR